MKASKVGIMAVAILLVVTGIGFGIAQAGGTHSEQPVLSFEDMEALDQGSSSSSNMESRPVLSFEDQEATQVAISPVEDTQMQNPIETGSLPYEELHGTEFPFPVGFVADSNEDLDPFSRGGP
jgi:hypothetical protein